MLQSVDNPEEIGLILHTGDPTNSKQLGGWNLPVMVSEMELGQIVTFSDINGNPVHGIGRNDMVKLFQIADCHVLATSGEGFGIPSAEAMSCGLPIILPDNSTGPELIGQDSSRGILVKNDTFITGPTHGVKMSVVSVESLADAMLQMVVDTDSRAEMGENARAFATEHFDWELITDNIEQVQDLVLV